MTVKAVVGLQYGDEGKGKAVDMLSEKSAMVVRYQGGPNAGHTVVNEFGKFGLHQIPSGIFRPEVTCLAGRGMVVNPVQMVEEIEYLQQAGVDCENLHLAERAHAILPHHRLLDKFEEEERSISIGTTLSGVGPCYAEKTARDGFQIGELLEIMERGDPQQVLDLLQERVEKVCSNFAHETGPYRDEPRQWLQALSRLNERTVDSRLLVQEALRQEKPILLEGQLGGMRDLDSGIYPFVTSSNPTPAGIYNGAGLPFKTPVKVIGIAKAYLTSVGAGPMPTELDGEVGGFLRDKGHEYGVTTGRPRRCGWFDAVAARQMVIDGGTDEVILTKLDVLSGLEEIKICVDYSFEGQKLASIPLTSRYREVQPVYESLSGWEEKISGLRSYCKLPAAAQRFVERIEELLEVPVSMVSVGPEREAIIIR